MFDLRIVKFCWSCLLCNEFGSWFTCSCLPTQNNRNKVHKCKLIWLRLHQFTESTISKAKVDEGHWRGWPIKWGKFAVYSHHQKTVLRRNHPRNSQRFVCLFCRKFCGPQIRFIVCMFGIATRFNFWRIQYKN